jgi:protein-disulfide isomerase
MADMGARNTLEKIETVAIVAATAAILWVLILKPFVTSGPIPSVTPAERTASNRHLPIEPVTGLATTRGGATKAVGHPTVTVIEFSDFQCPFCGRYARETFEQFDREFVETGKVEYAFRHFPLERIHPLALRAAEAAECSRRQGHYWQMHDRLFAAQQDLSLATLRGYARALRLDGGEFDKCLGQDAEAAVRRDLAEGERLGIHGTPTLLIGRIEDDGATITLLQKISGFQPYDAIRATVEALVGSHS